MREETFHTMALTSGGDELRIGTAFSGGTVNTLTGKFIHITGSVPVESPSEDLELTRGFVRELAAEILRLDGGLVVLVSKGEPNSTIPFSWDVIAATAEFESTYQSKRTLLKTVRRADYQTVLLESQKEMMSRMARNVEDITIPTYHWTGGAIREQQAGQADAAITIGGSRGVEDTAVLMQSADKPVLPLNLHIGGQPSDVGGTRLYQDSLTNPDSYMPRTHERLLARTDALVVQEETSAKRAAREIAEIMAEELSETSETPVNGELPKSTLRKTGKALDVIIKGNALYNFGKNVIGI